MRSCRLLWHIMRLSRKPVTDIGACRYRQRRGQPRMGIGEALPIAEVLVARLRTMKAVKQAEIAGSLRRRRETIGDVDLICALKDIAAAAEVAGAFVRFPEVQKILGQGNTKASVLTAGGLQVDLRIVPAESFGAALLYFTGSKEHNTAMRARAKRQDLKLNEYGLFRADESRVPAATTTSTTWPLSASVPSMKSSRTASRCSWVPMSIPRTATSSVGKSIATPKPGACGCSN